MYSACLRRWSSVVRRPNLPLDRRLTSLREQRVDRVEIGTQDLLTLRALRQPVSVERRVCLTIRGADGRHDGIHPWLQVRQVANGLGGDVDSRRVLPERVDRRRVGHLLHRRVELTPDAFGLTRESAVLDQI